MPPNAACALLTSLPVSSTRFSSLGTNIRQSTPAAAVTADKNRRPPLNAPAPSPIALKMARAVDAMITSTMPRPISRKPNIRPWVFSSPSRRMAFNNTGQYVTSPRMAMTPNAARNPQYPGKVDRYTPTAPSPIREPPIIYFLLNISQM